MVDSAYQSNADAVHVDKVTPGAAKAVAFGVHVELKWSAALHRWRVVFENGDELIAGTLKQARRILSMESDPVANARPSFVWTIPTLTDDTAREVRRVHASLEAFTFDPGGVWMAGAGDSLESGYTPRSAGDPIYHTICQVGGVVATRAELTEAVRAVEEQRDPELPKRMAALLPAIVKVAEALAANRKIVRDEAGMSVRIEGPWLPRDWEA